MLLLYLTGAATAASTRRIGARAREALPHAKHELIADAGHLGPITHPSEVNARITRYLVALAMPDVNALRKAARARWSRSGDRTSDRSLDQRTVESS